MYNSTRSYMASLSPPTTAYSTTTTTTTTTTTSSALSSFPFFSKKSQISIKKRSNRRPSKVSCKATDGDQNPSTSSESGAETSSGKFDRRNVLVGLGGLYGATTLGAQGPLAYADPVSGPDLSKCGAADLPEGAAPVNCCPPYTSKIKKYKLPPRTNAMRVRPAAHLANKAYIAKYNKAIELMKALPADDPRSFMQQADVHCAYCDGAYDQVGFPDLELQVHESWLFLPFHRWYLYFYERILGKLINDPTFALPFWNYDAPGGMQLPALYANSKSPIYDPLRDAKHQPPTMIDLDYNGTDETTTAEQQLSTNLSVMYRQVVSSATTAKLFMGNPYRAGDDPEPGQGTLETTPHGPVHRWTGDRSQPNGENMGNFYSAARDPIFFCHHSNVDRLWIIWKSLGGKRKDFTDPDFLNAEFLFYDENKELVSVKVEDCLDQKNLGYVYQEVDIPWLKKRSTPGAKNASKKKSKAGVANAAETSSVSEVFPTSLNRVVRVKVPRPKKSRSAKEKEEEEEILVVYGIELLKDVYVKFDVYINDEDDATTIRPDRSEFAGSFVNVPHKNSKKKTATTCLRLGISELLEDVGAEDDDEVVVTLVPKNGKDLVTIGGIKIEFDS
ncbi:polyphenol oxidase, chloroplastic-like [Cornus florida]|uniref:polyphenol oxidase, chloroplastic-like n=1 Tax=Cornus florida TaxID=4283 RepID=UPI00289A99B8|nr:polyphenol oxidase, chloroplastic-like [Cornus florida]